MLKPATSRTSRFAALLLVFVLIAAGCGSKSKSSGNAQSGGAQTTTSSNEGKPKPGGKLIYGLEADTSSPWTPANMICAISCHMVARTVYDPLALFDDKGNTVPNLAKSLDHNADFTQWTLVARDGVTFHDGTPFDGNAICFNLQQQMASFLTGKGIGQRHRCRPLGGRHQLRRVDERSLDALP